MRVTIRLGLGKKHNMIYAIYNTLHVSWYDVGNGGSGSGGKSRGIIPTIQTWSHSWSDRRSDHFLSGGIIYIYIYYYYYHYNKAVAAVAVGAVAL